MRQSNESWSRLIFFKRQLIEIFKGKTMLKVVEIDIFPNLLIPITLYMTLVYVNDDPVNDYEYVVAIWQRQN